LFPLFPKNLFKRKNGKKESPEKRVQRERRAISPGGCSGTARTLCARRERSARNSRPFYPFRLEGYSHFKSISLWKM